MRYRRGCRCWLQFFVAGKNSSRIRPCIVGRTHFGVNQTNPRAIMKYHKNGTNTRMLAYFIRHAQSENNARPDSQRVADPALTQVGESQAQRLGQWTAELGLTKLISSPFLRTLQTAEQVHLSTGLTAEVRPDWYEAGGCFSDYRPGCMRGEPGMSRSEIEWQFPGFTVTDGIDEHGWYKSPDRESYAEARDRAVRLVRETQLEFGNTDERIGFVIHCDLKRFLVEAFHDDWIDIPMNTSVTTVEFTPDAVRLVESNQVDHLPTALHTF